MKPTTLCVRTVLVVLCAFVASPSSPAKQSRATKQDTVTQSGLRSGVKLGDVVVYGSRRNFGAHDSQMSAITIDKKQIFSVPTYFGEPDVMKALQKLPGVQTSNDGTAGIFVRGGNYDQNLITLDGSTLYNAEHLKGFVSAINPDIVRSVNFYRGAFPARYGSRLSSIVDIGLQAGDFYKYHGQLSLGALASRLQVSGPIWKGRTSFNISGRVSYFDMIAYPLLRTFYDNKNSANAYSEMNYFDITAKLVHKLNERSRLSAVFYYGKDHVTTQPSTSQKTSSTLKGNSVDDKYKFKSVNGKNSLSENKWGNLVSSIYFTSQLSGSLWTNINLSYSQFRYKLSLSGESYTRNDNLYRLIYLNSEKFTSVYHSDIGDVALTMDAKYTHFSKHEIRFGLKGGVQRFNPTTDAQKNAYTKRIDGDMPWVSPEDEQKHPGEKYYWYDEKSVAVDTVLGKKTNVSNIALYAEDDYSIGKHFKANYGLRLSIYGTDGKTYASLEPRLAMRWLFAGSMSVKMSYSRMSQAVRMLNSNNLVMPSDIWVPITDRVPLMHSNLYAVGYNYDITQGVSLSVEGYYKTMDNVLEYQPGASYMKGTGDWQDITSLGKGRAYGVELYLEKRTGNTTGWVSYTWSKSLRTMDRPGSEINAGLEYYAANDRRNNFNATVTHRFGLSKQCNLDLSLSWSYITGRRGNVPTVNIYGGISEEYDPRGNFLAGSITEAEMRSWQIDDPYTAEQFDRFIQFYTYKGFNNYKLPSQHHLDVGVNLSLKHTLGESVFGISVYNIYNRMNVSNVYIGYHNNLTVLKGVCLFPIMPSVSYTHKF